MNKKVKLLLIVGQVLMSLNLFSQQYYLYVSTTNDSLKPTQNSVTSNDETLNRLFENFGVKSYYQSFPGAKSIWLQNIYEIHFAGNVDSFENSLRNQALFDAIYRSDYYVPTSAGTVPISDPWIANNWINNNALDLLNAQFAWTITTGDTNIIVGVVDTEFETTHEDLINTFVGVDSGRSSNDIHGTLVSSCVAVGTNNNKGIAAIGYNTKIKGYHATINAQTVWNGIWAAYQDGIKIINVSWSGIGSAVNDSLVRVMIDDGVVLVLSAGNTPYAWYHSLYADIPGIINVSGVDANNNHYANFAKNPHVDVCALSTNVAVCMPGNTYGIIDGTSFSAPQTAGVVALLRSIDSNLSPAEIENIIKATASPIADAHLYQGLIGTGRVNAYGALLFAVRNKTEADLIIRDTANDVGFEPNNSLGTVVNSPDIWVRRFNDGETVHQEPCSGDTNYIHIRVINTGLAPTTGNETVTLYWAKTDTSMAWQQHWQGNTYGTGQLRGDSIGTFSIPSLTIGQNHTIVVPWQFPNPSVYAGMNEPEQFSLLARIVSPNDTMTYSETANIFDNVRNNNNIAMKNVSVGKRMDLMVKDSPNDKGEEPISHFQIDTRSKSDIWVRHQSDNGLIHQNPIPDSLNYVCVKIKNIGCLPSAGNDSIQLFWAKTDTAMPWLQHWEGNYLSGTSVLSGNSIGTYPIPIIAKGKDTIVEIPWVVPNPSDYFGLIDKPWDFSLLARIKTDNDTMTYLETTNVESNVINNNNIAWKWMEVGTLDLMIQDAENDSGVEPNTVNPQSKLWDSPDIWVRHAADSIEVPQNPRAHTRNYVYVRITNNSDAISRGNNRLAIYWKKGATDLSWSNTSWTEICPVDTSTSLYDCDRTYNIPTLLPGKEVIIEIPWYVPDHVDYAKTNSEPCSFMLMAMIIADKDTMFSPLETNSYNNVRNNNNIAWKKVFINSCSMRMNVMIKDSPNDNGNEPYFVPVGHYWNSPDIWVRNAQDGDSVHQNPKSNQTNYVYVRYRNIGDAPSHYNDTLKLYWAKADANLTWDSCWNGSRFSQNGNPLRGNMIGAKAMPVLPAGKDTTLVFSWNAPNSEDYYDENYYNSFQNFHLLARIESEIDTMTFPETTNIDSNIMKNNNIACKNVQVKAIIDLMIKDNPADTGAEPNRYTGNIWDSPDIWVRHTNDDSLVHQNPLPNSSNNSIYVRVKNKSKNIYFSPHAQTKIFLYWARANSASRKDFTGNWNLIDSVSLNNYIEAGDEEVFGFRWDKVPDVGSDFDLPGYFYLMAVIQSDDDPINYYTGNVQNDVKYNNNIAVKSLFIGNKVNLMVRDNSADTGTEPNPTPSDVMWDSPDIWVQLTPITPGGVPRHDNPIGRDTNYVHVRVKNIGHHTSQKNEKLYLYWAKAGTNLDISQWEGKSFYFNNVTGKWVSMGGPIGSLTIPQILPGKDAILYLPWRVPDTADYHGITTEPWHFCLLAKIVAPDSDPMTFEEPTEINAYTRNNNNVAWKNLSVLEVNQKKSAAVSVMGTLGRPFCLRFRPEIGSVSLLKEAEIRVKLNDVLYQAWEKGGRMNEGIDLKEEQTFLINDVNASLRNLTLDNNELGMLSVHFNFLTQEMTNPTDYTFHVMQTDYETEEIMGGEVYYIITQPRDFFYADAGEDKYADKGEIILLSAEQINEPAIYNWYDQSGNLIHEGADFSTSVNIAQKYKLEVISLEDGYKDYAEIEVKYKPNKIQTVFPNPLTSNQLNVEYKINEADNAYLSISNYFYLNTANNYILDLSTDHIQLDMQNYQAGTYVITLVCNGVIADIKTFIKQ